MGNPDPIYQTLEDRYNVDEVEQQGPFLCSRDNAWLGEGYYFWDYHIELAHWWGEPERSGYREYIICQAFCTLDNEKCWDLHNKGQHRDEFIQALEMIISLRISRKPHEITVDQVIEFLKKRNAFQKYEAIRVMGVNSANFNRNMTKIGARVFFKNSKHAFYDLFPQIQICLFQKRSLNLNNYKVVWPEHYAEGYGI
ncbi:MAG: hypothetical protein KFKLKKLM_00716 [Flavobacteriales bacterium]|nr:hypothetical protein [Flavobacteriales bacterium]